MTTETATKTIRWWHFALIFVMILLFAMFAAGLGRDTKIIPSPLIGKPAYAFNIRKLSTTDETIKLSDYKGKIVVMNFWASWCVSCRDEHEVLLWAAKKYGADGKVQFIGINHKDNDKAAEDFLSRMGRFPYPSGVDPQGRLALEFGVYGMPETFFITEKGVIAAKQIGPLTVKNFEAKMKAVEAMR
jgi:cytochrome c biogenesis protein CcmG/thiol:disulfide interchange protein DsbE